MEKYLSLKVLKSITAFRKLSRQQQLVVDLENICNEENITNKPSTHFGESPDIYIYS